MPILPAPSCGAGGSATSFAIGLQRDLVRSSVPLGVLLGEIAKTDTWATRRPAEVAELLGHRALLSPEVFYVAPARLDYGVVSGVAEARRTLGLGQRDDHRANPGLVVRWQQDSENRRLRDAFRS